MRMESSLYRDWYLSFTAPFWMLERAIRIGNEHKIQIIAADGLAIKSFMQEDYANMATRQDTTFLCCIEAIGEDDASDALDILYSELGDEEEEVLYDGQ